MKELTKIPVSKVERAGAFLKTGVQIGANYVKYYAKKAMDDSVTRESLHTDNAEDIYNSLSVLKGSALKVAQMMSMDRNLLPRAYVNKFQMSQYSAPPLSGPLVVNTFKKYFGKGPTQIFDTFELQASNAASIGQVHKATLGGKTLAVKIQYPGVANSIGSDLKMVKPLAKKIMGISEADFVHYMTEIEARLMEETNYELEVDRGLEITRACSHLSNLVFPHYYKDYSSPRIITMDWMEGQHLDDFLKTNPSQEVRNKLGQGLWEFYDFQIHNLRQLHADPHPGNFLMRADGTLGIIDFGCVKVIPEEFYNNYFTLLNPNSYSTKETSTRLFYDLKFIYDTDTEAEKELFTNVFVEMANLLGKPFHYETFDFGDDEYFKQVYDFGEQVANMKEVREARVARGLRDSLYINRTYYGLYTLLNELKAVVQTKNSYKAIAA